MAFPSSVPSFRALSADGSALLRIMRCSTIRFALQSACVVATIAMSGAAPNVAIHRQQATTAPESQQATTAPGNKGPTERDLAGLEVMRPTERDLAIKRSGFYPNSGESYTELFLPPVIGTSEIERWSQRLALSEAQAAAFGAMYQAYLNDYQVMREKDLDALWAQSASVGGCFDGVDLNCAYAMRDLMNDRDRIVHRISARENQLFAALETLLSDNQLASMRSVRLDRERRRLLMAPFERFASGVDLTLLLDRLAQDEPLTPVDPAAFQELLAAYESTITHQMNRYVESMIKAIVEGGIASASWDREINPETGAQRILLTPRTRVLSERRRSLWRANNSIEKRLMATNQLYARSLADLLPEPVAARFMTRFREFAFGSVYPDPFDATAILNLACIQPFTDPAVADSVQLARVQYLDKVEAINDRMLRCWEDWMDVRLETRNAKRKEFAQYKSDMDAMNLERRTAAADVIENLKQILPGESLSTLADALAAWAQAGAAHAPEEVGISYRP